MAAALLTFVIALGIVIGGYWAFVVRLEDQAQSSLRRRLKGNSAREKARLAILKEAHRFSHVGFIERALQRNEVLLAGLQKLIDQAGVGVTPGLFLLTTGVAGLGTYLAVSVYTPWVGLAAVAGIFFACMPFAWLKWKRTSRLRLIEEQFPDAVDLIARALRAGHAFTTGISMVSEEVGAPVGPEFQLLYEHQNFGMPLADALRRFGDRLDFLDARFFVTAVLTQRESGGNLSEVLDNLSAVIRERFKVKRQVRVLSAHGRITGWVLMAMPPIMAIILFQLSPETTSLLVTDPLGIRMLIGAAILQVIGAFMIRRIVDVEYLIMPTQFVLALVAVFISVALAAGALVNLALSQAAPERRRLRRMGEEGASAAAGLVMDRPSLTDSLSPVARRLAAIVPKSPSQLSQHRRRLTMAGTATSPRRSGSPA